MNTQKREGNCALTAKASKQTWLSQDVATRILALGLKQRLETESPGGLITCTESIETIPIRT